MSEIKDQMAERRTSASVDRSNLIKRWSVLPSSDILSSDIDINSIATNRIMLSGLVRFVPVNKRERERMASVPESRTP